MRRLKRNMHLLYLPRYKRWRGSPYSAGLEDWLFLYANQHLIYREASANMSAFPKLGGRNTRLKRNTHLNR
jgi:hypothetical protein